MRGFEAQHLPAPRGAVAPDGSGVRLLPGLECGAPHP